MSFADLARQLAQTAIVIVGDIAVDVTFRRRLTPVYNPATDTTTGTFSTVTMKGVIVRGKEDEDDSGTPTDVSTKLIIAALDLPGYTPNADDTFAIGADIWEIVKMVYDPTRAVYIFTIRVP